MYTAGESTNLIFVAYLSTLKLPVTLAKQLPLILKLSAKQTKCSFEPIDTNNERILMLQL